MSALEIIRIVSIGYLTYIGVGIALIILVGILAFLGILGCGFIKDLRRKK